MGLSLLLVPFLPSFAFLHTQGPFLPNLKLKKCIPPTPETEKESQPGQPPHSFIHRRHFHFWRVSDWFRPFSLYVGAERVRQANGVKTRIGLGEISRLLAPGPASSQEPRELQQDEVGRRRNIWSCRRFKQGSPQDWKNWFLDSWNGAESNLAIDQKISNDLESVNKKNREKK